MDILDDESQQISLFLTTLDELANAINKPYKIEGLQWKKRKFDRKGRFCIKN
jgi:hypothetical protein